MHLIHENDCLVFQRQLLVPVLALLSQDNNSVPVLRGRSQWPSPSVFDSEALCFPWGGGEFSKCRVFSSSLAHEISRDCHKMSPPPSMDRQHPSISKAKRNMQTHTYGLAVKGSTYCMMHTEIIKTVFVLLAFFSLSSSYMSQSVLCNTETPHDSVAGRIMSHKYQR